MVGLVACSGLSLHPPCLVPALLELWCLLSFQFKRLQGKRNRGREEINFVDIKGDDQLSGAQQWLTKSLTEEKTMKSFSKVQAGVWRPLFRHFVYWMQSPTWGDRDPWVMYSTSELLKTQGAGGKTSQELP